MGINSSNPVHSPATAPAPTIGNGPVLSQKPITDKMGDGSTAHANGYHQTFTCKDAPVENQRPLKVRVIGAGYSGVYLGIRIPQRLRNIDLKIYEKNEGVGGTWWENRYPGCACDIPCKQENFL
jgi:hypothetical protein